MRNEREYGRSMLITVVYVISVCADDEQSIEMATQITLSETLKANDSTIREPKQEQSKCPHLDDSTAGSADRTDRLETESTKIHDVSRKEVDKSLAGAKRFSISNITNLSAEEEDELLNEGDIEMKDDFDELSEGALLAGSSDEENAIEEPAKLEDGKPATIESDERRTSLSMTFNEIVGDLGNLNNVSTQFEQLFEPQSRQCEDGMRGTSVGEIATVAGAAEEHRTENESSPTENDDVAKDDGDRSLTEADSHDARKKITEDSVISASQESAGKPVSIIDLCDSTQENIVRKDDQEDDGNSIISIQDECSQKCE